MTSMLVLLLILVGLCVDAADAGAAVEQKSSRLTVNPNLMWIVAVAAGFGMLVLTIAILMASTFLLRRYEKKRLMLLAPMLAQLQHPTTDNVNDQPRQMTAAGPPSASAANTKMTKHDALSVSAVQPLGVGHVYYNRGMDVDEGESETTQHLDPRPIEIVGTKRQSYGQETSYL